MEQSVLFEKTFKTLEATGTNWTAKKLPLVTTCGKPTGSFGMFRSDNDKWLGTVKDRYTPMQNSTLAEMLLQATERLGLEVSNGGILKGGARVFYQVALPQEYIGKSKIRRNITAMNSHDGSTAIVFGSSNTVVVCENTFYRAYREMEKVRHTMTANERVQALADNIKQTIDADIFMMEGFKRMADVELRDEMVERLVKKLFSVDLNTRDSDISTRRKNNVAGFAEALNTEIKLEGKTLWGLFNAVTRYTNHVAAPTEKQKHTDYLMAGAGRKMSNLAFDELMSFIDKRTVEYVAIGE